MDPIKLAGVRDWPMQRKLREVQGFIGFANFYQQFIKNVLEIARLLNNLAKKDTPWKWEDEHQKAFEELKKTFLSAPVLKMLNPNKPYQIKCDASNYATGAILSQEYDGFWHLIAYQLKSFNKTMKLQNT